ncbi:hypothetical protein Pst134EA_028073 [Puccinia striiformis f. sp. tritici]|uniref:hypothetical protein n=1 Tax=Puccinia striiformis f. sp. tritici TaxID=168172 RepID=UPI0020077C81|nr:hypothetical protein Pst134EA_028073 [Puccinia striiformis f. sp. tritici]KAH9448776.1 hypothetical protein Pst134EA_028073 [Puccinia striiformis f. sp. tritici]
MSRLVDRITPSGLSLTATTKIRVSHLSPGTSLEDVLLAFGEVGPIRQCILIQRFQDEATITSAIIQFSSVAQAVQAAVTMDGVSADDLNLCVEVIPEKEDEHVCRQNQGGAPSDYNRTLLARLSNNL